MPVHHWEVVEPNLFHHFHQAWTMGICNSLNEQVLPAGYSALIEQHAPTLVPGVITLENPGADGNGWQAPSGGGVLAANPPKTKHLMRATLDSMASRGNRIAIRHSLGRIVCVIEIVSPGNKRSKAKLANFVDKAVGFLQNGVNLLIVDLFPPSPRDPQGIHKAIWDAIEEQPFQLAAEQPLTLAAYIADPPLTTACVEPLGFGEKLPDMPAYLDPDHYVLVPLEATYQAAWETCPAAMRAVVERAAHTK